MNSILSFGRWRMHEWETLHVVQLIQKGSHLEHPHQLMQNFYKFAHLKSIFSILHSYFYKMPISVCLLYTFIQIKYSSSDQSTPINPPTQPPPSIHPPNHHHQPPSPQNPLIKQKIQNWSKKKSKIENPSSTIINLFSLLIFWSF